MEHKYTLIEAMLITAGSVVVILTVLIGVPILVFMYEFVTEFWVSF